MTLVVSALQYSNRGFAASGTEWLWIFGWDWSGLIRYDTRMTVKLDAALWRHWCYLSYFSIYQPFPTLVTFLMLFISSFCAQTHLYLFFVFVPLVLPCSSLCLSLAIAGITENFPLHFVCVPSTLTWSWSDPSVLSQWSFHCFNIHESVVTRENFDRTPSHSTFWLPFDMISYSTNDRISALITSTYRKAFADGSALSPSTSGPLLCARDWSSSTVTVQK